MSYHHLLIGFSQIYDKMAFCILLFSAHLLSCCLSLYGSRRKMNLHIAISEYAYNLYTELMIVVLIAIHQKENMP
jgi:hypothetical protein